MADKKNIVDSIGENLNKIFRHILPGMFIISIAYISKPNWFTGIDIKDTKHLIFLSALSILIGNSLYVINRYIVVLLYDYILVKSISTEKKFFKRSVQFIIDINKLGPDFKKVLDLIELKKGQLFYMLIMAEALIAFTCYSNYLTFLKKWNCCIYIISGFLVLFPLIQICLVFKLEEELIKPKYTEVKSNL
jgi:hypothetical protein